MALCVWFSKLEPIPSKAGRAGLWMQPRAWTLIQASAPGSPVVWATTDGGLPSPFALGVASLSSAQILALDTDPDVWARELPAGWRSLTVADLPAAVRTKINGVLTERGLTPGIQATDSLPQAFQKILDSAPFPMSNPDLSLWPQNFRDGLEQEPF